MNKICFIGAGNLATQLSVSLQREGFAIEQIFSRTEKTAGELAARLNTEFTCDPEAITREADMYFVALKDAAFEKVLHKIDFQDSLVVHCSGSMPLSVISGCSANTGVFYPLQTFSKTREVDFRSVPVFVESDSEGNRHMLIRVAKKIAEHVSVMNSEKRKILHISAVFACNFVNHLYTLSSEILNSKDIPFDVIKPLIEETTRKVQVMDPEKAQTGPAVRFDKKIISDHVEQLSGFPGYAELYNSLSKSIFEHHQKSK